jgi:isoleucyl-tRNA synthetase
MRGEDLKFSTLGVDEIAKKLTLRLDNVRSFYEMYATGQAVLREQPKSTHALDRWIIARWNETHNEVTHFLETNELDRAAKQILPLIDDLSTWWLRRSRDRLKGEGEDRAFAEMTLGWVLFQLSRLLAPFTPFLAEDLYQRLPVEKKLESVHLEQWPVPGVAIHTVLDTMEAVRKAVTLALEQRAKNGIKVRQPLAGLHVGNQELVKDAALAAIIADELNVKTVTFDAALAKDVVELDLTMTPELKREGVMRDVLRAIQEERKRSGLNPGEAARLLIGGGTEAMAFALGMQEMLSVEATILDIKEGPTTQSVALLEGKLEFALEKM